MKLHGLSHLSKIEEENRDLGFGAVVARDSRQRLLNRDGSFNVVRNGLKFWSSLSLYHLLLTVGWIKFLTIITISYLAINSIFAAGYVLCGSGALQGISLNDHFFLSSFFFSIHTFSTIGYGHIIPIGITSNILVTIESLVGLLWLALATGLIFARFSRPTVKVIFSDVAVVAPYRGITAFEFRIANARKNQIIELQAKVMFSRFEEQEETHVRKFYELELERSKVAFFPLSWTIVHPITETSPFYGVSNKDLQDCDAEILILLTGIDETFSQSVHARSSYKAEEIIWNAKFKSIFNEPIVSETLTINMEHLSLIETTNNTY